jgi:DMSO/TMAO reductase YedYZ molybdopterin-dependent catalytic subunit
MSKISRRKLLIGGASAGGILLAGVATRYSNELFRVGEDLSRVTHRLLLRNNPLAREFTARDISRNFPAIGTTMPESESYQRLLHGRFAEWRLPVGGLVDKPLSFSLADLQAMPARTQITAHSCERGWTAIAEWTGVQLSRVLELVKPKPKARWVAIHCADGWWDSYSLDQFEALHPQTLLTYGMNGGDLPVQHGAPVRLRIERQLGWKSLKYVDRIELVEDYRQLGYGKGSLVADEYNFQWYGGI